MKGQSFLSDIPLLYFETEKSSYDSYNCLPAALMSCTKTQCTIQLGLDRVVVWLASVSVYNRGFLFLEDNSLRVEFRSFFFYFFRV